MYYVDIKNDGGYLFEVKTKEYTFFVDLHDKGATPPDTLLAAIGSCIGVYVRKYAEGTKLPIKDFTVSVSAEFSKEAPICFKAIDVIVDLKGAQLDERRLKALTEFVKNCPVHNTMKIGPEILLTVK